MDTPDPKGTYHLANPSNEFSSIRLLGDGTAIAGGTLIASLLDVSEPGISDFQGSWHQDHDDLSKILVVFERPQPTSVDIVEVFTYNGNTLSTFKGDPDDGERMLFTRMKTK